LDTKIKIGAYYLLMLLFLKETLTMFESKQNKQKKTILKLATKGTTSLNLN
jgi:hypothetical protein